MSGETNFDNYIKNELGNYSAPVSPRIWDNIAAARGKRKPVGFWVNFFNTKNVALLIGSLAVLFSTIWFLNESGNKKSASPIADTKITSTQNNITPSSQENTNIISSSQESKQSGNNSDGIKKDEQTLLEKEKVALQNEIAQTEKKLKQLHTPSANIYPIFIAKDKYDADKLSDDDISSVNNGTLMSRLLFDAPEVANAEKPATTLQYRSFPNVTIPGCPTVEEAAAGNKKYVEVYIGPDFTLRNFKDTTAQSAYLQKRKASTEVSFAYSAGIRYTKVFTNGMSVKAGLNYSQVNEKFSFVQKNLVQVTYVIDPNTGDTTGSYTITGTRKKTTYNKYRTLDLPLLIGYELGNGRLHVNINAGAMVNVYSWQRGEVLDTNYQPVSITTGKSGSSQYQFKTNVGVGLTGGIGVYYKLTDQLHLLAEPYFRYNLQPMSKDVLTLQQKYNTIGVRFGVRLDLE